MKIFINNEEVVSSNSFEIEEELLNPSTLILNNVYPKTWEEDKDYSSRFYYPKDFSSCKITDDLENVIFAGIVRKSGEVSLNPRDPKFVSLQIIDYKTLLSEGKLFDYVLNDLTIPEAIQKIVGDLEEYGFYVGNINLDYNSMTQKIGAYSTLDQSAYDLFQYFSEITSSIWFTRYDTELDIVYIDFYSIENLPTASQIEYNNTYFKNNEIVNMTYNYSTDDYRNKQIITSDSVVSDTSQSQTLVADGVNTEFNLDLPIASVESIKVYVGGAWVDKSFITNEEKAIGLTADFYYSVGETKLESETTYLNSTQILVEYTPYIRGRQVNINQSEVERITNSINRSGLITRYENRNDLQYSSELYKTAEAYIKFKGNAEITLTIESMKSDLFNLGDKVFFNAPLDELKTNYMVKKKTSSQIINNADNNIVVYEIYKYELSSTFNEETEINYFDNQRRKNKGNIESGQFIERNVDLSTTYNIVFENLVLTEVQNAGNNILEFELEGGLNN